MRPTGYQRHNSMLLAAKTNPCHKVFVPRRKKRPQTKCQRLASEALKYLKDLERNHRMEKRGKVLQHLGEESDEESDDEFVAVCSKVLANPMLGPPGFLTGWNELQMEDMLSASRGECKSEPAPVAQPQPRSSTRARRAPAHHSNYKRY